MEFYQQRLEDLISDIPTERVCGRILCEIFDRTDFREAFYQAPAARVHHQNYPGGLLEHTINVTCLALALADAYATAPGEGLSFNNYILPVDRPLLITAGLLHDIGKIETYQFSPLPEITEANRWEGHLVISYGIVRQYARSYVENPPYTGAKDEIQKLLHCILSHHGSLEYGSPVLPACVEALLLSQADLTDSRLASLHQAAVEIRSRQPEARWVPRELHFPGGIFIGDWKDREFESD